MFKELLEFFTKQFIKRAGRKPQTPAEVMSIQDDVVRHLNKTKGDPKKLTPQSMINERYRAANPFLGFKPTVIQGGKSKEGITSIPVDEQFTTKRIHKIDDELDKLVLKEGKYGKMSRNDRENLMIKLQDESSTLQEKTLFKDSPEAIAKIKADNKAAMERLRKKKMEDRALEDFTDDFTDDPSGLASGGLARVGMLGGGPARKIWQEFIEKLFIKSSNDIRLGKGKWKGLNQDQWIKQHDDLTKMLKKWEMSGKKGLPEGASEYLGMNNLQITKAIKDATKKVKKSKIPKDIKKDFDKEILGIDPETSGKFTKAEVLIQMLKNTIKGSDDPWVKQKFPKWIKEIEANPKLADNENVWKELTGGLPKNQKLVVHSDDSVDFFTQSKFGPHNIEKTLEFQKKHNLSRDQANKILRMDPEDRVLEMKRLETVADRSRTSDQLFDAEGKLNKEAVLQEVKNSEEKMLLDKFDTTGKKGHASGGIAGQLHLNEGGRVPMIFGGSAGLKGLIASIKAGLNKGRTEKIKTLFPKYSVEDKELLKLGEKYLPKDAATLAAKEIEAKAEGIQILIDRLKHDKKLLERQAKNKAMNDPNLDFMMESLEKTMPEAYGPHLKKYTDIDKDILQLETIKKNLIMKDRKLNAEGGLQTLNRQGYASGTKKKKKKEDFIDSNYIPSTLEEMINAIDIKPSASGIFSEGAFGPNEQRTWSDEIGAEATVDLPWGFELKGDYDKRRIKDRLYSPDDEYLDERVRADDDSWKLELLWKKKFGKGGQKMNQGGRAGTGLNYLLGEDDQNVRTPYQGGLPGLLGE